MSAGRLKYTVVRVNPETMAAVALLAGSEVPEWASDLVGADDLDTAVEAQESADDAATNAAAVPAVDYASFKVPELVALIAERNEGRDEADVIPNDGKKDDLIAALKADDARAAGDQA